MFGRIGTTLAMLAFLASSAVAGEGLGVGDKAPRLVVQEWVKGTPVASFESGRSYVVEFWATWCGPCKKSIPHLTELQRQYDGKVTFIGVSVWEHDGDQSVVAPFVESLGDKMAYAVATDRLDESKSRGAMAEGWMRAAGQNGIPTAFIVDGTGRIAWIGSPMSLEEPLEQVVAGTWDLAAAKQAFAKQRAASAKTDQLQDVYGKKDWAGVIAAVDEIVAEFPEVEGSYGSYKFRAYLETKAYDQAWRYAAHLLAGPAKDNAIALNSLAWSIVDPEGELEQRDAKLAVRLAERANQVSGGGEAAILDTLATAYFQDGQTAKAIEVQKRAVEKATDPEMRKELQARLELFEKAAG